MQEERKANVTNDESGELKTSDLEAMVGSGVLTLAPSDPAHTLTPSASAPITTSSGSPTEKDSWLAPT